MMRKPAPVQATWLDYFDTTGVPEIDYVLTDAIQTPAAERVHFRERIVWLPGAGSSIGRRRADAHRAPSRRAGR